MADPKHLEILAAGVESWNQWRRTNPDVAPDLSDAPLHGIHLSEVDLRNANLTQADLSGADLRNGNLRGANLSGADLAHTKLYRAVLIGANLSQAELTGAFLDGANCSEATLKGAFFGDDALKHVRTACASVNFYGADLTSATFFRAYCEFANFTDATLTGASFEASHLEGAHFLRGDWDGVRFVDCWVFGISVWDMKGTPALQSNLIVTPTDQPLVAVDDLDTAQFIYLLLNNEKLRNVFDAIGSKAVLILGRFSKERKPVLEAIRNSLRKSGFLPILFDFKKLSQRDFTETIKTLAGLSRFIIADITNPRSTPLELQAIIPDYMIPLVPILSEGEEPFAMFQDLQQKYRDWVLDVLVYDSTENLLMALDRAVVKSALERSDALFTRKAEVIRKRHVRDYQ